MIDTRRLVSGGFLVLVFLVASSIAPTPSVLRASAAETCDADVDVDAPDSASGVVQVILRCADTLGLSRDQRARLDELTTRFVADTLRRRAQVTAIDLELGALLRVDPRDPAKPIDAKVAEAKVREMGRILTEIDLDALRVVEASKAVLTGSQRAKLTLLLRDVPKLGA
jgi:hypothetical protein